MVENRGSHPEDNHLNVLVVEDFISTAELLKRVLVHAGFRVHVALDIESAMQAAKSEHFDIVVSDLCLPDGTGWELMENLKAQGPIHGIVVSALSAPDNVRRSFSSGFEAHLVKPVDIDLLVETVRGVSDAD
jgi:CheY-like chemotaxis protein